MKIVPYFGNEKLKDKNLNLSLHLCGSLARSAILNNWNPTLLFLEENINLFKRAQLFHC